MHVLRTRSTFQPTITSLEARGRGVSRTAVADSGVKGGIATPWMEVFNVETI